MYAKYIVRVLKYILYELGLCSLCPMFIVTLTIQDGALILAGELPFFIRTPPKEDLLKFQTPRNLKFY